MIMKVKGKFNSSYSGLAVQFTKTSTVALTQKSTEDDSSVER